MSLTENSNQLFLPRGGGGGGGGGVQQNSKFEIWPLSTGQYELCTKPFLEVHRILSPVLLICQFQTMKCIYNLLLPFSESRSF